MRKAVFMYSAEFEHFHYPVQSPFKVNRAPAVRKLLDAAGLLSGDDIDEIAPKPADRMILKKFHTPAYIKILKDSANGKFKSEALEMGIGSSDCPNFKDMYYYSALACGASVQAAELINQGKTDLAFNPSGGLHHAMPARASGFCYLNDVVLACMTLAEAGKKVLYLDVDVHHGDGTQHAFYERSDVMTISLHQSGRTLFPGTGFVDEIGDGDGKGYSVNLPLPIGTYDEAYLKAFSEAALPLIKAFAPDAFVLELGTDALAGDPLANLQLTNNTYATIIENLLKFNVPILMAGGGGYNFTNTVRAWILAWCVLCGKEAKLKEHLDESEGSEAAGLIQHLRDEPTTPGQQQKQAVEPVIDAIIEEIKKTIFSIHGL
jgi:acetoin utilization protein AcuC